MTALKSAEFKEMFDSHCHLDDERFDQDRDEVVKRMKASGVTQCVCVGSDLATSERSLTFAQQTPGIFAAAGVHPHEAKAVPMDYLMRIELLLKQNKAVALGEIGLDYFYDISPRDTQVRVFLEQLELARMLAKPVIFHIRDAHGEMIEIFRTRKGNLPHGIIHCFSGSEEVAEEYVSFGFYISFAGALTFKNANKLKMAACAVPINRLLIETDSPYISPEPLRGRRNEPANVGLICQQLALLRGMEHSDMARITTDNAMAVYGIVYQDQQ